MHHLAPALAARPGPKYQEMHHSRCPWTENGRATDAPRTRHGRATSGQGCPQLSGKGYRRAAQNLWNCIGFERPRPQLGSLSAAFARHPWPESGRATDAPRTRQSEAPWGAPEVARAMAQWVQSKRARSRTVRDRTGFSFLAARVWCA